MRTAKTLIRLGRCPGWSESSLGAQSFCWFCHVAAHIGFNSLFRNVNKNEPGHEEMYLTSYSKNKGADQPAHPRSLISAFVVRCLDSIISLSRFYNRNFKTLASFCGCAVWFVSGLVGNSRRHVLSCRGSNVYKSEEIISSKMTK